MDHTDRQQQKHPLELVTVDYLSNYQKLEYYSDCD